MRPKICSSLYKWLYHSHSIAISPNVPFQMESRWFLSIYFKNSVTTAHAPPNLSLLQQLAASRDNKNNTTAQGHFSRWQHNKLNQSVKIGAFRSRPCSCVALFWRLACHNMGIDWNGFAECFSCFWCASNCKDADTRILTFAWFCAKAIFIWYGTLKRGSRLWLRHLLGSPSHRTWVWSPACSFIWMCVWVLMYSDVHIFI